MPHPLERIRQSAELHGGLWQSQASHWSFDESRNRRQRARNIRHIRRNEDRRKLVDGLLIFVCATQTVPTKEDIRSALTPAPSSRGDVPPARRPTYGDIQSLL